VSIAMMTAPVTTRLRATSTSIYPTTGHWPVPVPQLVTGTRAGSMVQPAAGIQADPTFIRNRVVEVAKLGSPPRGAPR
jgi:hypothetical protein